MFEIYDYLPGFLAAYAILFIGTLSPGPSVAMLVGLATGQGRTPALMATLGIAFGSATINVLTILGIGLLLSEAAALTSVVRVIGALYLLYLAFGAFKNAARSTSLGSIDSRSNSLYRHVIAGYILQVTNPKAIAFWLAISSVGAVEGASYGVILLYITGGFFISFVGHAAWAVSLSSRYFREAYYRKRKWIEMSLGAFFVFAAYKLTVSER